MKKGSLIILYIIIITVLSSCRITDDKSNINDTQNNISISTGSSKFQNKQSNTSDTSTNTNSMQNEDNVTTKTKINNQSITMEDFNIYYGDTVINDSISFREIAEKLKIELGIVDNNIEIKARAKVNDNDYSWYIIHYPNKEEEEIQIECVVNESLNKEYLVSTDLINVATNRNIIIGDDVGKLTEAYGDTVKPIFNTSSTDCYNYKLDNNSDSLTDKIISIVVDKNSEKITKIFINYNSNKAMEDMNITSFD